MYMLRMWLVAAAVVVATHSAVLAQAWPRGVVTIVVAYPPGGPTDIFARIAANALKEKFGYNVIVENRPGAGGTSGTDHVAKATPDGQTLLLGLIGSLAVGPAVSKTNYDTLRDFAPIRQLVDVSPVLVSDPKLGFHSLADLIAYAKANPGKLNYASAGSGTLPHLLGALLGREAGINMVHVPYRGGGPAAIAVMSGECQILFADTPAVLGQIQSSSLTPLAVTSAKRDTLLPAVPTVVESGIPALETEDWFGLLAPAATPVATVEDISAKLGAAMATPAVEESLRKQDARPVSGTPADFASLLRREVPKWGKLARDIGVQLE